VEDLLSIDLHDTEQKKFRFIDSLQSLQDKTHLLNFNLKDH